MAEWSKATDCKSVEVFLRRFESCLSHLFVVDFREEKGGIRQRRKAHRAKLFLFFLAVREVKLYRMLVREVGELLRSIDSPSISNPNENRSESLPACSRSLLVLAYVVVGLPTRTRPPECLLGSGRSQADNTIGEGKTPHFIAPGERKFDRGLERRGGMEEKARDGFRSLCASRMR